jgi:virginiamycin B lyase
MGITLGSDGNIWFTGFAVAKVGQLNAAGSISENVTPTKGSAPWGMASGPGPNLNVWFTESAVGKVGQITTTGPPYTEYTLPVPNTKPVGITLGPDGNMWVTDPGTNSVWRIQQLKKRPFVKFTQFALTGNAQPMAITTGPDSAMWFTEPGTNRIGRLPTSGYPLTEYSIPTPHSDPTGICAANDNSIWFTELKGKNLGRLPMGASIVEYPLTNSMTPNQVLQGVDGNFYFTDTAANRIGQFMTRTHKVDYFSIPTKDSQPTAMTLGLDNEIYLVETAGNKIAQFRYFAV